MSLSSHLCVATTKTGATPAPRRPGSRLDQDVQVALGVEPDFKILRLFVEHARAVRQLFDTKQRPVAAERPQL